MNLHVFQRSVGIFLDESERAALFTSKMDLQLEIKFGLFALKIFENYKTNKQKRFLSTIGRALGDHKNWCSLLSSKNFEFLLSS
jgi:hypothetical protein